MLIRPVSFLFLLLTLSSCNFQKNETVKGFFEKGGSINETSKKYFVLLNDSIVNNADLEKLVLAISENNRLDGPVVGYGGTKSDQYKRYETLEKYTSDSSLFRLSNHKNPVVRVYAYNALIERNSPALKFILLNHTGDNEELHARSGCDGFTTTVNKCLLYSFENYEKEKRASKRE